MGTELGTDCPECGSRETVYVGDDGISGKSVSESYVCQECKTGFTIEYYAECKAVDGEIVERL